MILHLPIFFCFLIFSSSYLSDTDGSGDTHKRSKSILKNKADARLGSDPESERLLSDTGSGVSDISVIPVSYHFHFITSIF